MTSVSGRSVLWEEGKKYEGVRRIDRHSSINGYRSLKLDCRLGRMDEALYGNGFWGLSLEDGLVVLIPDIFYMGYILGCRSFVMGMGYAFGLACCPYSSWTSWKHWPCKWSRWCVRIKLSGIFWSTVSSQASPNLIISEQLDSYSYAVGRVIDCGQLARLLPECAGASSTQDMMRREESIYQDIDVGRVRCRCHTRAGCLGTYQPIRQR